MAVKQAFSSKPFQQGLVLKRLTLYVSPIYKPQLVGASLLEFRRKTISSIAVKSVIYVLLLISVTTDVGFFICCDRKMERKGRERLFNKIISFVYFWYGVEKVNVAALHAN